MTPELPVLEHQPEAEDGVDRPRAEPEKKEEDVLRHPLPLSERQVGDQPAAPQSVSIAT